MKRLIFIFLFIFAFSAGVTQLILAAGDLAGITVLRRQSVPPFIYMGLVIISGSVILFSSRTPKFNGRRIGRLLSEKGYCPEVYAELLAWQKKCEKHGCGDAAKLVTAEMLIEGAHYEKGFELLRELDIARLPRRQKQVCYNTWLYGAVVLGDRASADEIYRCAEPWLSVVTDKNLISGVKHTLGCYEYMCGRKIHAEELFGQSIDSARSSDVLCENWLALSACYLDSGRNELAKKAVETAMRYCSTTVQQEKISRAKQLVEQAWLAPYTPN